MEELILDRAAEIVVREDLQKKLKSGKRLRVKYGIDPTGPVIHLGRASTLRRLRAFQDLGHQVVLIIGDFTAKIGDASDKTSERQVLTDEEIKANMKDYRHQLGMILDMDKVELHYNSEWFNEIDLSEFIALAQQFTVAQMIERENFSLRYKENRPIGLHEFLYPILQGYDSVAIKADVEIGGTDQLFNLMAGRTIQKYYGQDPQNILTFDLLEGTDGRKMSTSWGNVIYITDTPEDMYGKVMSIPDELIAQYYRICTDIEGGVIEELVKTIASGANPRDSKASLASEIVAVYHGKDAALKAEEAFNRQFRYKQRPEDIDKVAVNKKTWQAVELLRAAGLADSNSEARRLLSQGGIRLNDEVVSGEDEISIQNGDVLQAGKRRFVELTVK